MAYGHEELTLTEKLTRKVEVSPDRALLMRKSYTLLGLAAFGMGVGGYIGVNTPFILNLFTGWIGWIIAMVALNAVPPIAMKFKDNPPMGTLMLFVDGMVAGLVLSPMLYIAQMMSGYQIVTSAALVTLAVFLGVTIFVQVSGTRWAPSRALYFGIFAGIAGAVVLNMFMGLGFIGMLIAVGIGVLGVMALVSATSEVLHNPDISTPVPGALMLFAGVFMVFQAALHLIMSFTNRD